MKNQRHPIARGLGSAMAATLLLLVAAPGVWAICNVIPWHLLFVDSDMGSVSRPFAAPGETFEMTIGDQHADDEFVVTFVSPQRDGSTIRHVLSTNEDLASGACADGQIDQWHAASSGEDGLADLETVERGDRSLLRIRLPEEITAGPLLVSVSTATASTPVACTLERVPCDQGNVGCIGNLKEPQSSPYLAKHFMALPPANDFAQGCIKDETDSVSPCSQAPGEISENVLRAVVDTDGNVLLHVKWDGILTKQNSLYARVVEGRVRWPFPTPPARASLRSLSPSGQQMPPLFEPHANDEAGDGYSIVISGTADAPQSVLRVAARLGTCEVSSVGCELDSDCEGDDRCIEVQPLFSLPPGPLNLPNNPVSAGDESERGFCSNRPDKLCGTSTPCEPDEGSCALFDFELSAAETVALAGILGTEEVLVLARSDCGENPKGTCEKNENSWSISLRDRATWKDSAPQVEVDGQTAQQCGLVEGSDRAVERVMLFAQALSDGIFVYPGVVAEDRIVALIESEEGIACEGPEAPGCGHGGRGCDLNNDGDRLDGIVRVFRIGTDGDAIHLTGGRERSCSAAAPEGACQTAAPMISRADAQKAPRELVLIDGKPLALANGKVWASDSRTATLALFDTNSTPSTWIPIRDDTLRASVAGTNIAFSAEVIPTDDARPDTGASARTMFESILSDGIGLLELLFATPPVWSTDPRVNDAPFLATPTHIRLREPWVVVNYMDDRFVTEARTELLNVGAIQYLAEAGTGDCLGSVPCPRESFIESHGTLSHQNLRATELSGNHILQKEFDGLPGSDHFVLVGLDRDATSAAENRWPLPSFQGGQRALAGTPVQCGDTTLDVFAIEWNEAASQSACTSTGQGNSQIPCPCSNHDTPGDCNGDGDVQDTVLGVLLVPQETGTATSGPLPVIQTGYAARPCDEPTCDPENPYRFDGSRILFLSNELDQAADLDGNGAIENQNVVVKVDFCPGEESVDSETVVVEVLGPVAPESGLTSDPLAIDGDTVALSSNYGRCAVDSLPKDCTAPNAPSCGPHVCDGASKRCTVTSPGACRLAEYDCPGGTTCVPSQVTTIDSIQDSDGDGIRDTVDRTDTDGCSAAPRNSCRQTTGKKKSSLKIIDANDPNRSRISWRWLGGETTSPDHLGDPISSDDYEFCLYDGNGALVMNMSAPSGQSCGRGRRAVNCWRTPTGTSWSRGYGYRNPAGVPNGARWARLKHGEDGKARAEIRGAGSLLELPDLNALQGPLRAQLQGSHGTCFDTTFSNVTIKSGSKNRQLKAVAD